jgi:hypothetical protein
MSINLDSLKNRLQTLQQQSAEKGTKKTTDDIWKPEVGTQQVRIVPYIHNKENPFIELYFHYNIGKRSYLSPITYGNPDPIVEFSEKLKTTGVKEDWVNGKKLEPKMRVYVPVLVRGQEDQGVKFWGFGIQVYQELLSYIADPDYGDITDPINGRDIVVEVRPPADTGKSYPETNIRIKPNQTKASEDKNVINFIKNQKKITEIFTEYSYDELKDVLNKWLNPEEESEITSDYQESVASSAKPNTSTTKNQIEDAFAELFNQDN